MYLSNLAEPYHSSVAFEVLSRRGRDALRSYTIAMCGYGVAFLSGSRWHRAGEPACSSLQSAAGE